jgi:predicted Zn-dependent protease
VTGGEVRQEDRNGITRARATFSSTTSNGEIRGEVAFLRYGGSLYRILGYASPSAWPGYASVVASALGSFAPLTDQAVLNVQPWRLRIVRLDRAMTLTEFNQRYPSVISLDQLARLNRVTTGQRLAAGSLVKRVEGRALP